MLRIFTEIDSATANSIDDQIRRGAPELASTLIKVLYKSGNKFEGTPYLICLEKRGTWKKLIDVLQAEAGLPYMHEKPIGVGKPPASLGTAAEVNQFQYGFNLVFNSSAYLN